MSALTALDEKIAEARSQVEHFTPLVSFGPASKQCLDFWEGRLSGLLVARELIA